MRRYVLSFEDYSEAVAALRKLRRRGVVLRVVVVVVEVDDHRKVQKLPGARAGNGAARAVIIV